MENLHEIFNKININRQWIFSGIGSSIILLILGFILRKFKEVFFSDSKKEKITNDKSNIKQQNEVNKGVMARDNYGNIEVKNVVEEKENKKKH